MDKLTAVTTGLNFFNQQNAIAAQEKSIASILQGGNLSAQGYRQQGLASLLAGNYEVKQQVDYYKKQNADLYKAAYFNTGSLRAQVSASGFGVGSQSDLDIMNANLSSAESAYRDLRTNTNNSILASRYKAELSNWQSSVQADNATYQAQIQAQQAQNQVDRQKRDQGTQLLTAAATLLLL